tara:strand:- start:5664 stop:6131 length:468 start_codon:yes stop_codon:yes gene_type:complete
VTAEKFCIGIVVSQFNEEISNRLLDGACTYLENSSDFIADISVHWVPGAFEIPFACQEIIDKKDVDAVITLGSVVKGGTPHFDFVAGECIRGIQTVSLSTKTPISLGVLTTNTYEQALERSNSSYVDHDGSSGDKGTSAAEAAVAMIRLNRSLTF